MPEDVIHRNPHPDLHPLLLEFHEIEECLLREVWYVFEEGSLGKIILGFDEGAFVIEAEPYDDTIVFHFTKNDNLIKDGWVNASHSTPWSRFIGAMFGWGWILINQQDCLDGILLSFDGIIPQLMLNVMASSIKVLLIYEHSNSTGSSEDVANIA